MEIGTASASPWLEWDNSSNPSAFKPDLSKTYDRSEDFYEEMPLPRHWKGNRFHCNMTDSFNQSLSRNSIVISVPLPTDKRTDIRRIAANFSFCQPTGQDKFTPCQSRSGLESCRVSWQEGHFFLLTGQTKSLWAEKGEKLNVTKLEKMFLIPWPKNSPHHCVGSHSTLSQMNHAIHGRVSQHGCCEINHLSLFWNTGKLLAAEISCSKDPQSWRAASCWCQFLNVPHNGWVLCDNLFEQLHPLEWPQRCPSCFRLI